HLFVLCNVSLPLEGISRCETQHLSSLAWIVTTPIAIEPAFRKFDTRQILSHKLRSRCFHNCIRSADIESLMTGETRLDGQSTCHCRVSNIDISPQRPGPT